MVSLSISLPHRTDIPIFLTTVNKVGGRCSWLHSGSFMSSTEQGPSKHLATSQYLIHNIMHAIASAARSAIGEAIFSRSYLYLQPGHLLPRSSSFLNSGYVVRTWSSSRSLKQEVGSESPGSEGKGKEREVESDRSEKSAGAGAGAGVAEEDVELPSEGNRYVWPPASPFSPLVYGV